MSACPLTRASDRASTSVPRATCATITAIRLSASPAAVTATIGATSASLRGVEPLRSGSVAVPARLPQRRHSEPGAFLARSAATREAREVQDWWIQWPRNGARTPWLPGCGLATLHGHNGAATEGGADE